MITAMANKKQNTTLSSYAYTYLLDGNQSTKTDYLGQITSYEYDGLGRLKKEIETNTQTQYAYDEASNRSKMTVTGTNPFITNYEYDANNRLVWEETEKDASTLATTEYYYDANGNQVAKLFNDLTDSVGKIVEIGFAEANVPSYEYFKYDGFNQLIEYRTPSTKAEYTYKTGGLRIAKTVDGTTTKHVWDGSNIVMELNTSNQVMDRYIRGNGLIKNNDSYYMFNAHNDVIQLADSQGIVTGSYLYDAFGVEKDSNTVDNNPFRFCAEYTDFESGYVYLRARYYDPSGGRFISEDPIRHGLNWYEYANSNPLMFIDPSGEMSLAQIVNFVSGVVKSLVGTVKALIKTPGAVLELGSAIYHGDITKADMLEGLGAVAESIIEPINYVFDNTYYIFAENPTDEEVEEYGKKLGEIIQTVAGVGLSGKLASKLPKLSKALSKMPEAKADKFTFDLQLFAKSTDIKFPKSNSDIKKIFGVSENVLHREIKPEIIKQIKNDPVYSKDFYKVGTNPDIGVDSFGNIVLRHPTTKEILPINWPLNDFLP